MGNSLSTHSFQFYGAQTLISFLGKAFVRLRLRKGSPFFVCTTAWGKILLVRTLSRGVIPLKVGVVYSNVVRRQWIIF